MKRPETNPISSHGKVCKVCGGPAFRRAVCIVHFRELVNAEHKAKRGVPKVVKCLVCEKSFAKWGISHRYCSYTCRQKAYLAKLKKFDTPSSLDCAQCGIKFIPVRYHAKYCSDRCYENARLVRRGGGYGRTFHTEKVAAICLHCKKAFEQPAREYRCNRVPKYCSPECHYEYKRTLRGKPAQLAGKSWEIARRAAVVSDEGKCCICESMDSGFKKRQIPVDHIIPRRLMERWGFDPHQQCNLACLCIKCHGRKTHFEWRLFEGDMVGFLSGLRLMGYPLGRVIPALESAELSTIMAQRVYIGTATNR